MSRSMSSSRLGRFCAATVAVCSLAACGTVAPPAAADGSYVIEQLQARNESRDGARYFADITELLDNTRFEVAGSPAIPLTDAVVVGRVAAVEPGAGFRVEGEDAPGGIQVDFEDDRALWHTVHVHVDVDQVVSGDAVEGTTVTVGFALGTPATFDKIADGFLAMGDLLLFLLGGSPVFEYDPSIYATMDDGALLALVDPEGRITLPVLDDTQAATLTGPAPTVQELRRAAAAPVRVVRVDGSGARVP